MQSGEVAVQKELIWIKTYMEKKVDKILPREIFILISFNVKAFTQVNSQRLWMNFNTFPNSGKLCDSDKF